MPKLKTCRGARKRFKITKTGKVKCRHAGLRHILSSKPKSQKAKLGMPTLVSKEDTPKIKRLMPYS